MREAALTPVIPNDRYKSQAYDQEFVTRTGNVSPGKVFVKVFLLLKIVGD